jgi:biopolymer transport protein ExbD
MSVWRVRHEGSPRAIELPSAQRVLEGIRDGEWEPSDEVRGPNDTRWIAIEDHPLFAETMAELDVTESHAEDETRLDMNPLIDVALVLLIFFIITTTYASLRRTIDLPPQPEDSQQKSAMTKMESIKDRVIRIKVRMENLAPVVRLEDRVIDIETIEQELSDTVGASSKTELYLDVSDDVPWGVEAKIHDAAKGAKITQIYWPKGK